MPIIESPTIDDLKNNLEILKNNSGKLILRNDLEDKLLPYEMVLYSDDHNSITQTYMVLFSTVMEDGDINIRTVYEPSASGGFISMLGEPFGKTSTTQDFSLICKVFCEFLETGDVNKTLLDE